MKFLLLLPPFFLLPFVLQAQKIANPADFSKSITPDELKAHLQIIAGAAMEGRNTPSPGLEKAADYITAQLQKSGVKPGNNGSYRQTYSLSRDSATDMDFAINGSSFIPYEDFAPGFSLPERVNLVFKEYVFSGFGIVDESHDDYQGMDVKDRLVIFMEGQPDNYKSIKTGRQSPASLLNKIINAQQKGAAAILVIREKLPSRLGRNLNYTPEAAHAALERKDMIPVFYINENVVAKVSGERIQTIKSAIGNQLSIPMLSSADVLLKYESKKSIASASNIIGVVEGSDKKDEYVLVTAHYDHVGKDRDGNIYYGADDDGSGTVGVLEIADAFAKAKKAGKGPRRTVVFMTVSGEEKGLWGSQFYASNPVFSLEKTSANLNIDMIGRIGTDYLGSKDALQYVYVVGDDKLSTDLKPVTEKANNGKSKLVLDRKFNDPADPERIYYRSDHYSFASMGVPAIFYFDGIHEDYHKPTDTVDKINFELLAKRTRLVFNTAWEIANRDGMMKRDLKLPGF